LNNGKTPTNQTSKKKEHPVSVIGGDGLQRGENRGGLTYSDSTKKRCRSPVGLLLMSFLQMSGNAVLKENRTTKEEKASGDLSNSIQRTPNVQEKRNQERKKRGRYLLKILLCSSRKRTFLKRGKRRRTSHQKKSEEGGGVDRLM